MVGEGIRVYHLYALAPVYILVCTVLSRARYDDIDQYSKPWLKDIIFLVNFFVVYLSEHHIKVCSPSQGF